MRPEESNPTEDGGTGDLAVDLPEADGGTAVDDTARPVPAPAAPDDDGDREADPVGHPLVQDLILNPTRWRIWPAVAVLRWLQRRMQKGTPRLVFRSRPSLGFAGSEVHDVMARTAHIDLVLNAPGLAAAGSPLPSADISRIVADYLEGGPLAAWLDGPGDRFMHLLEDAQLQNNPAYALMAGGRVEALSLAADLVGRSAPLAARAGGDLRAPDTDTPTGAAGLAGAFLGAPSASGLRALFQAFTGLAVEVEEFSGATVPIARPARVGLRVGMMVGMSCRLPSAGVAINLDGADDEAALAWAREPVRRESLHRLATSYIGAPSPEARIFLLLDADAAPAAALDGGAALGGLAVLGRGSQRVRLPLAA